MVSISELIYMGNRLGLLQYVKDKKRQMESLKTIESKLTPKELVDFHHALSWKENSKKIRIDSDIKKELEDFLNETK